MINLLPPETKEMYYYGKRNRVLAHWIIMIVLCLAGGMAITAGGYIYINRTITSTKQDLASSQQQLNSLNQASVQKQVTDISNNIKLSVQVLSKEILFSKLLQQLGAVTPNNVILTNLSITQGQSGVDLTADTTNYAAATQLQVNLADPKNQIFGSADIENINCSGGASTNTSYPCVVTIRALFDQSNPFLFINSGGKGKS